ncbi:MAG: CTP synthase [Spirochaetes bacterium]|nr:MAG: CTP synthase [Spirochaetota bacterium]
MSKYIFVTGGVCSSLGKGVAAASIGSLLECMDLKVRMIKIDPYINVDAGTMSPYQHGEVYVTDDGAETDLDLGNYERFTSSPLSQAHSITTGQIYQEVIKKEREGRFLGRTVQVIPHITDEIKRRIYLIGEQPEVDITITEIGGTVGDIESIPFLEAARQFIHDLGEKYVLFVHLTLIPMVIGGELKTKPTQHSVKALREIGIQPDILLCRAPYQLDESLKQKISLFTNVEVEAVISAYDIKTSIYEIPLLFHKQRLDEIVLKKLGIPERSTNLNRWENVVNTYNRATRKTKIAIVGKYVDLHDTYKSIHEAILHGGIANNSKIEIKYVDSEKLEKDGKLLEESFSDINGILVPGGFGQRGIQGMIEAARYAREKGIVYLGICLGMQIMVIEYARNVLKLEDADSTEFSPGCRHPVITLLTEQVDIKAYGGTMRLGKNETHLLEGTLIREIYNSPVTSERHRHRYEVSNKYRKAYIEAGLIISGVTPDGSLVEAVEWPNHPWGIGVQYHPEFKSKPFMAHPLFKSFIKASLETARIRNEKSEREN